MTYLYLCPKCKSANLRVMVEAVANLLQDDEGNVQTDIASDHEWGDDALMLCDACEHDGPSSTFYTGKEPEQFEGPSVGVMLPAQGAKGRLFTPRISGTSTLRLPMQLSDADNAKIGRGRPWQAFITDQNTGKRYQVIGAECEAGPHCFCDAVIVERADGGKP